MDRAAIILEGLNATQRVGVEIGALDKPIIQRSDGNIIYVDYTDRASLAAKYRDDPFVNIDNIVDVDAIWGSNTLADAVGHRKVDYVIASHVIEHVPDLITWLAELRSILNDTGEVRLVVPDRRFTFDYLREETRFSDILAAWMMKARCPQPHELLDYLMGATAVDCSKAWEGTLDLENLKCTRALSQALDIARDALENGSYHDAHCWVFTPRTFAKLFVSMAEAGLMDFACARFHDTQKYSFEFFVTLRPSTDREEIVQSWKRMQADAHDLPAKSGDLVEQQQQTIAAQLREIGEQEQALRQVSDELAAARSDLSRASHMMKVGEIAEIRVAEMERSNSWRITAPLRSAATIARRWSR